MKTAIEQIFEICSRHVVQRGTQGFSSPSDFEKAAHWLFEAQRIVIVTGFTIAACGIGETDGPSGSVALAAALEKLGKQVCLITDSFSEAIIQNLVSLLHLDAMILVRRHQQDETELLSAWEAFQPDLLVGLERPGRAKNGRVYSMHALDITEHCPDTDFLFYYAKAQKIPTICIGDGGNEVGMGKVAALVAKQVPLGDTICASFAADVLLACGVSNWGGMGLAGLLSILSRRDVLHTEKEEQSMIYAMADSGAVDGVLKKIGTTIDGFTLEENLQILRDISFVVQEVLQA